MSRDDHINTQSDFGVMYFVDENPRYRRMLRMSIESLRRFHPNWPVEVMECPSFSVPLWKKAYRAVSFWKAGKRRNRAGQDVRVIAAKADAMLRTPFRRTLFLDVDTVVMNPLDAFRRRADSADVMLTPLAWKSYARTMDFEPENWPYMMTGVFFFSHGFLDSLRTYLDRYGDAIVGVPTQDQYVISLLCAQERDKLNIVEEASLQIDVMNLKEHLGTAHFPKRGEMIDLSYKGLSKFHVFHYNEYKPQYMEQIEEVWGLTGKE